ncbi:MAG: DUF2380 domain-containing protein [Candidatus Sericytochromatia bacterium]|nr:DUF2380 domain-containing protein [Candidatus Sericytochromatia bacterium]
MQRPTPVSPLRMTAVLLATTVIITGMAPAAQAYPTYRLQGTELVAAGQAPKPNERLRVAVVDFRTIGAPTNFGEAVAENLRNELVHQQKYTVVERSQIQQALKEQHFGQTGLVDAKQAITLGRLLGAKVIVVGSVTKIGSTYTVNARFIDVETGEATDARSLKTRDVDDIASVVDELAIALSGKSTTANETDRKAPTGKSKLLASGMSLLFPGAGQFYNGNVGWGIAQLVLNIAGFSVAAVGRTQGTADTTMYGLGSLMMLGASGWSAFDGWFTTQE